MMDHAEYIRGFLERASAALDSAQKAFEASLPINIIIQCAADALHIALREIQIAEIRNLGVPINPLQEL